MSLRSLFTSPTALPSTEIKKVNHACYFDYPNVPVLPTRLWPVGHNNEDNPDLRSAYTYEEVKRAVADIRNIRDYDDVIKQAGGEYGTDSLYSFR
ncbi:hypothetical protein NMY22_g20302 [Coprinellus aureogranulatus]|nr:hypothetical protein NMY22_g20302 [Coprinellus aureogranulatus]